MDILGLLSDFELKINKNEMDYKWGVSENFFSS